MLKNFLQMQNNNFQYRIVYSTKRRKTAFRFAADGILEVLAPQGTDPRLIEMLISANTKQISELRARTPVRQQLQFTEGSNFMLLGKLYPLHFTHRLRIFDNAFMIPRGSHEEMRSSMTTLYRELASSIIRKRLIPLQQAAGVIPKKIQISAADTRWGSCSAHKHISFSWKLIQCPVECVDYVIGHELSHIKEMNHSPEFWKHVEKLIPDYRKTRKLLNSFAAKLPEWD